MLEPSYTHNTITGYRELEVLLRLSRFPQRSNHHMLVPSTHRAQFRLSNQQTVFTYRYPSSTNPVPVPVILSMQVPRTPRFSEKYVVNFRSF